MKSISTLVFALSWVTILSGFSLRRFVEPFKDQVHFGLWDPKNATISKYPYTVAILTKYNEILGGGMIYKSQWIITSGNVGDATSVSNITVRVGSDNALDGGQLFDVSKVFFPPSDEGCLALIKLNKKINFSKTAKPIKIADGTPISGSVGYVTGYGGDTDLLYHLQRKTSTIYDHDTCRDKWWMPAGMWMTPNDICAMGSSCYGDHGDPLVYKGRAVGVFRRDVMCSYADYPVIYCEIAKFRKWIDSTIKQHKQLNTVNGAQILVDLKNADGIESGHGYYHDDANNDVDV